MDTNGHRSDDDPSVKYRRKTPLIIQIIALILPIITGLGGYVYAQGKQSQVIASINIQLDKHEKKLEVIDIINTRLTAIETNATRTKDDIGEIKDWINPKSPMRRVEIINAPKPKFD